MNITDYTKEIIEQRLQEKGYRLVNYKGIYENNYIIDNEGYQYFTPLHIFLNGEKFKGFDKVHKTNVYSIENIKNFINLNNLNVELVSTEYINNNSNLIFRCSCGNTYERTWANFYRRKGYCCSECSKKLKFGSKKFDDMQLIINEIDLKPILPISPNQPMTDYIDMIDSEGFLYYIKLNYLYILGREKDKRTVKRIGKDNPYSIYNINLYLKRSFPEFVCINTKCNNHFTDLIILHTTCGTKRKITWAYLQTMIKHFDGLSSDEFCTHCRKRKLESYHASVLKQVFAHEYPDTILEDKTCINEMTGYSLPTDIVNHRLKIAIEIQSQVHDTEARIKIDKYKRDFWISNGYDFYDPDIRDYSIIEMIQLFFPQIESIPDYIDYHFSNAVNYIEVQKCFDKGMSVEEVAEMMNIKVDTIQNAIRNKKVSSPSDCAGYNVTTPIVRLNFDGEKIEEYQSIQEADRNGYCRNVLYRVLYGSQLQAYNSYWVTKDNYISGNYIKPNYDCLIDRIDRNGKVIQTYNGINEAIKDSMLDLNNLKIALYFTKSRSHKGEYWRIHK